MIKPWEILTFLSVKLFSFVQSSAFKVVMSYMCINIVSTLVYSSLNETSQGCVLGLTYGNDLHEVALHWLFWFVCVRIWNLTVKQYSLCV